MKDIGIKQRDAGHGLLVVHSELLGIANQFSESPASSRVPFGLELHEIAKIDTSMSAREMERHLPTLQQLDDERPRHVQDLRDLLSRQRRRHGKNRHAIS